MPAYQTHALYGEKFYDDNCKDEKLFKEECDFESLKTYSLGIDLLEFSKPALDVHNLRTRDFLFKLIKSVKERNLVSDKYAISMLYGHILHYFLDINMHPYIYYHEQGLGKPTIVESHTIFEGYLSYYFTKQLKGIEIEQLKPSYFNKGNMTDSNLNNIINESYRDIYNRENMMEAYKLTLKRLTQLETLVKLKIFNRDTVETIFGFKKLEKEYGLTDDDFHNESNKEWYHPITGEKHTESAQELFDKALEDACYAICDVNDYLYGNKNLSELETVFTDLSYDTGVHWSIPKDFNYLKDYESRKVR